MNCKHCSSNLPEGIYFCPNCGHLADETKFQNQEIVKKYEQKMISVIEGLKGQKHIDVAWNATADRYANVIEQLQYILELPEFKKNADSLLHKADKFLDRCRKPEFHIAFIGTVKAGKSTLINALLDRNLASTSVTPETAVLTKFRHSEGSDYINVDFYTEEEWAALWKDISDKGDVFKEEYDSLGAEKEKSKWIGRPSIHKELSEGKMEQEIEEWTSSKKVAHYFVKEVEIGLREFNVPQELIFVDTPGLDDPVQYRSKVTKDYLDRANAVIVCIKAQDATKGSELDTLSRIFTNTSHNRGKVHIVGTWWDAFNTNPQQEWQKMKEAWVRYVSDPLYYGSKMLAEQNILHSAAYLQNLAREYNTLNEEEHLALESIALKFKIRGSQVESRLDDLMKLSNVSNIKKKIDDIAARCRELLYQDIEESYKHLQEDISKHFGEIKETKEEILQAATADIATIQANYEKAKKDRDELHAYRQQLADTLKQINDNTTERINVLSKQLSELIQ